MLGVVSDISSLDKVFDGEDEKILIKIYSIGLSLRIIRYTMVDAVPIATRASMTADIQLHV
jgi:hypothetical protein